jgi:hypothetical protein
MGSNVIFPQLPTYVGVLSWGGTLSLIVTAVLPIIAGLFMRAHWSALTKGLILLAVAAVKAFLEAWIAASDAHTAFAPGPAAYATVVQFALGVVAYFGLWRNTGLQQAALTGGIVPSKIIDGQVTTPVQKTLRRR